MRTLALAAMLAACARTDSTPDKYEDRTHDHDKEKQPERHHRRIPHQKAPFTFLSATAGTSAITGRLVVDGKPLTSYALSITHSITLRNVDETMLVTDADGRFTISNIAADDWVILAGARGYGRIVIPDVHTNNDELTDLGDIPVKRGARVAGRVLDADGRPVAAAEVRVEGGSMIGAVLTGAHFDELGSANSDALALRGRQIVHTDADGRYVLLSPVPRMDGERLTIVATDGSLTSRREDVPATSTDLDLRL